MLSAELPEPMVDGLLVDELPSVIWLHSAIVGWVPPCIPVPMADEPDAGVDIEDPELDIDPDEPDMLPELGMDDPAPEPLVWAFAAADAAHNKPMHVMLKTLRNCMFNSPSKLIFTTD